MEKMFSIFTTTLFLMGIFILSGTISTSFAGPAPKLTSMRVVEVWDDLGNTSSVDNNYPYSVNPNITFKGNTLYLKTKFTGYPNWATVFYREGSASAPALKCTTVSRDMIGNPATGWYQTVAIPFNQFSGSYPNIYVTAFSANGGGSKYTVVSNIHIQK